MLSLGGGLIATMHTTLLSSKMTSGALGGLFFLMLKELVRMRNANDFISFHLISREDLPCYAGGLT